MSEVQTQDTTPKSRWQTLNTQRSTLRSKWERYAALTIPKVLRPSGHTEFTTDTQHDWQSVGSQAVNNLTNKIMLALFAPSRPFFRIEVDSATLQQIAAEVQDDKVIEAVDNSLAVTEKEAVKELDKHALRPHLYDTIRNEIVTGNALLILEDDNIRVLSVDSYCVVRNLYGDILEILIKEETNSIQGMHVTNSSDDEAKKHFNEVLNSREITSSNTSVSLYTHVVRHLVNDKYVYRVERYLDDLPLGKHFQAQYTPQDLPYCVQVWDLKRGDHYGTGLVEDYCGDFEALSRMSKAIVETAILCSQYRWLANPSGQTKPSDLERSPNGAVIPGFATDLHLMSVSKGSDLQIMMTTASEYINRIGVGFLLHSAVQRDAERVTAEEVRTVIRELETAFGNYYSGQAINLQKPLALWLLEKVGGKKQMFAGDALDITVITGLHALSRNGDLEILKEFLTDVAQITTLPPQVGAYLHIDKIMFALASARGLQAGGYVKTAEQVQQEQMAAQMQQMMAEGMSGDQPLPIEEGTQA